MVLQKKAGASASGLPDVISKYTGAIPVYGAFISQAAGIIRDVLRAQPDVIAFDYETTMMSDAPEALRDTVNGDPLNELKPKTIDQDDSKKDPSKLLKFDQRFGWLQYGFYALVETEGRSNSLVNVVQSPKATAIASAISQTNLASRKYDPDKNYYSDEGWLIEYDKKIPPGSSSSHRLTSKYVIFSITPYQLSEKDETLRAASGASMDMLNNLRQTEQSLKTALDTVNQGAELAGRAIIKAKAESLADRLTKRKGQTPERFNTQFEAEWSDLLSGLSPTWNSPTKIKELSEMKKGILDRQQFVFESLDTTKSPGPEEAIRAINASSNSVLLVDQANDYRLQSSTNYDNFDASFNALQEANHGVSNLVFTAKTLSLQIHSNATIISNLLLTLTDKQGEERTGILKNATNIFNQLDGAVTRIEQALLDADKGAETNKALSVLAVRSARESIRLAALAQHIGSNAVALANSALTSAKSARIGAADALRDADDPTKISVANQAIMAVAKALSDAQTAAEKAAVLSAGIGAVTQQADNANMGLPAVGVIYDNLEVATNFLKLLRKEVEEIRADAKQKISGL